MRLTVCNKKSTTFIANLKVQSDPLDRIKARSLQDGIAIEL